MTDTASNPTISPRAAKEDLLALDSDEVDVDAEVWWRPGADRDGHLVPGDFSYISVEVVPADSTHVLDDVLKRHGLVIRNVDLGAEGFRATLTYEGLLHGNEAIPEIGPDGGDDS